jgi:hypothetical protein
MSIKNNMVALAIAVIIPILTGCGGGDKNTINPMAQLEGTWQRISDDGELLYSWYNFDESGYKRIFD